MASAAAILAMSKATSESEHLKDMLVGNILAVSWAEVGKTAALYGVIGAFHYVFRRQFLAISMDHEKAEARGHLRPAAGTSSSTPRSASSSPRRCSIAGVLLVFCYLIVPSVAAMLYADRIGPRLAIGWTMGTVVSALGVYLSVKLDLPTGATIVCTFGARPDPDGGGEAAPEAGRRVAGLTFLDDRRRATFRPCLIPEAIDRPPSSGSPRSFSWWPPPSGSA